MTPIASLALRRRGQPLLRGWRWQQRTAYPGVQLAFTYYLNYRDRSQRHVAEFRAMVIGIVPGVVMTLVSRSPAQMPAKAPPRCGARRMAGRRDLATRAQRAAHGNRSTRDRLIGSPQPRR
jgi:hypothetical protein